MQTQQYDDATTHPLERERRARGWSRAALARSAGIDPVTIWRIERRGLQPRRLTALVLAHRFGVEADVLFPNDDRPDADTTGAEAFPPNGRRKGG